MKVEQLGMQIAERAYYIWQQQGCPEGQSLQNWLQAEAELRNPPFKAIRRAPNAKAIKPAKRKLRRH